jgi:hypothetical protein
MKKCVICGNSGEGHHILTQKAYPELKDKPWNIIPLTREYHSEWHNKGVSYMAEKYFQIKVWLKNHNWSYCEVKKTWVPPSYK